jgi:hypothetical protein
MHGGNRRKIGIDEGLCNLCKQPDSARHWLLECSDPVATESRNRQKEQVEQHLATLVELDYTLQHFIRILAMCVTRHEDGHMHKVGMIPHARLSEIEEQLGIAWLTEEQRQTYHTEAVKLGTILMDGVLEHYIHKKSNGRISAVKQRATLKHRREQRKAVAVKKAKEKRRRGLQSQKFLNRHASQTMPL